MRSTVLLQSPGTEQACGVMTGHATANYPSETWRESLSCVSHIHRELTLIPFPLHHGQQRLFNGSKEVFKASCIFLLPTTPISLKCKNVHFCSQGQSMTEPYLDWPDSFSCILRDCSDLNIQMHRHISSSHLYARYADVCLIWYL